MGLKLKLKGVLCSIRFRGPNDPSNLTILTTLKPGILIILHSINLIIWGGFNSGSWRVS